MMEQAAAAGRASTTADPCSKCTPPCSPCCPLLWDQRSRGAARGTRMLWGFWRLWENSLRAGMSEGLRQEITSLLPAGEVAAGY